MLASYWPFGAGIAVFLGLVIVVLKLVRRKPAEESPTEEEDSGPRWWQRIEIKINWGVFVPVVFSVIALLVALFSGPSEKEITLVRNDVDEVKSQLANVDHLKLDLGKVREDADANTQSLTVLAGRIIVSDQKIAVLQKSVARADGAVTKIDSRVISLEDDIPNLRASIRRAKASQDSINAGVAVLMAGAVKDTLRYTDTERTVLKSAIAEYYSEGK